MSSSNVERSLLRGQSDRDFGSVSLSQHDKEEFCLKGRIFTNAMKKKQNALFKVNVQLRKDYLRLWGGGDGQNKLGKKKF